MTFIFLHWDIMCGVVAIIIVNLLVDDKGDSGTQRPPWMTGGQC